MTEVKIGAKNLAPGMSLHEFPGIATLAAGASQIVTLGINFNDTTQPAKFDLVNLKINFVVWSLFNYH
jgi:AP-3 complex subunit beta